MYTTGIRSRCNTVVEAPIFDLTHGADFLHTVRDAQFPSIPHVPHHQWGTWTKTVNTRHDVRTVMSCQKLLSFSFSQELLRTCPHSTFPCAKPEMNHLWTLRSDTMQNRAKRSQSGNGPRCLNSQGPQRTNQAHNTQRNAVLTRDSIS